MSSWVAATASITSMNPATESRSGSRHPTNRMTRSQKVANAEHDGKAGSVPGDPGSDPTGEQVTNQLPDEVRPERPGLVAQCTRERCGEEQDQNGRNGDRHPSGGSTSAEVVRPSAQEPEKDPAAIPQGHRSRRQVWLRKAVGDLDQGGELDRRVRAVNHEGRSIASRRAISGDTEFAELVSVKG
jgi:hypothetical protein